MRFYNWLAAEHTAHFVMITPRFLSLLIVLLNIPLFSLKCYNSIKPNQQFFSFSFFLFLNGIKNKNEVQLSEQNLVASIVAAKSNHSD